MLWPVLFFYFNPSNVIFLLSIVYQVIYFKHTPYKAIKYALKYSKLLFVFFLGMLQKIINVEVFLLLKYLFKSLWLTDIHSWVSNIVFQVQTHHHCQPPFTSIPEFIPYYSSFWPYHACKTGSLFLFNVNLFFRYVGSFEKIWKYWFDLCTLNLSVVSRTRMTQAGAKKYKYFDYILRFYKYHYYYLFGRIISC